MLDKHYYGYQISDGQISEFQLSLNKNKFVVLRLGYEGGK